MGVPPQPARCQPQFSLSGGRGVTVLVIVGRPRGAAPPMPRKAILAKSVSLSGFSELAATTLGVAPGRVLGHASATCLIGGVAAVQLGGTDSAPIEEARPKPADNTGAAPLPAPSSAEPTDANAPVPEPPGTAPKRCSMASSLLAPSGS